MMMESRFQNKIDTDIRAIMSGRTEILWILFSVLNKNNSHFAREKHLEVESCDVSDEVTQLYIKLKS